MNGPTLLRYIELKTGYADNGPALIARVRASKSGRTIYVAGKALKRAVRGGISGNFFDRRTGEEYWVSGVKRNGQDRHWAGSGKIDIEASAVPEYLQATGASEIDTRRLNVISDLPATDPQAFYDEENERLVE
jgi:hypothetical protein